MKLAFCLFNYFPYGGLQRDFLRIAKECIRRGHEVDVYTTKWEGERDPQLKIKIIPVSGWQNHVQVLNFIKQIQPVFKNYDLTMGFNKIPGVDFYYAADTCYQTKTRKKHGFLYRLTSRYRTYVQLEKNVFEKNSATKILLISPMQQAEFVKYYETPAERFYLLPPGIAKDRIAPDNFLEIRQKKRAELNLSENDLSLLMVGSGFKTKGLDRILLGVADLPTELKNRSQLFIIGKDKATSFRNQAKKLKLTKQIHFLGGRDDVPDFLLAADLLVHPAYNENTGTVLLEAIVSGLPVLTTDVCGYAFYVEKAQAGMVIPSPFDQKQFNQTLANMLSSPSRKTWQANGFQFAKTADIYSMPERVVDILERGAL